MSGLDIELKGNYVSSDHGKSFTKLTLSMEDSAHITTEDGFLSDIIFNNSEEPFKVEFGNSQPIAFNPELITDSSGKVDFLTDPILHIEQLDTTKPITISYVDDNGNKVDKTEVATGDQPYVIDMSNLVIWLLMVLVA
jgi:hypothetical protein